MSDASRVQQRAFRPNDDNDDNDDSEDVEDVVNDDDDPRVA